MTLAYELDYALRSLRLGRNFLTGGTIHANLQLTYRCNLSCRICDFWKEQHHDALDLDGVRTIARRLRQLGSVIVSCAGGEPLLRTDLEDCIAALAAQGHFPILITNGWFVDAARARSVWASGLHEISVSVDYRDPARHDAMRGKAGCWERAVEALRLLLAARPDARRRVHLITVLMDDNLDEIEPLVELAAELGVTAMVNLYSPNRGAKAPRLPDGSAGARLLGIKRRHPGLVTLTSYIERFDQAIAEGGIGGCRAGKLFFNIGPNGDVHRCTESTDRPLGNLLREDMRTVRDRLHAAASAPCSACWTSCRGFAESMFRPPRVRQMGEFLNSVRPR